MAHLNDKIVAYLTVNKISYGAGAFITGQPAGEDDQILSWDDATLGPIPSESILDAAYSQHMSDNQWDNIRSQRNAKLAACDWTQLPDSPLTNTQQLGWASYRQALRDITLQSDPFNIVWPEEPAA
jgi:hypothetical protein